MVVQHQSVQAVAVKYDLDAYLKSYIAATQKAVCEYSQKQIDDAKYDKPCCSYEKEIKKGLFLKFCLENIDCYSDEDQDKLISVSNRYAKNCGDCTVTAEELAAFKTTPLGKELSKKLYDVDVQLYIDSSSNNDVVFLEALDIWVKEMKAAKLWDKFYAIYPLFGGDAYKTSWNLKDTSTYRTLWFGGVTFPVAGADFDGSTGYGDTQFSLGGIQTDIEDIHISFYTADNNNGLQNSPMGTTSFGSDDRLRIAFDASTNNHYLDMWSNGDLSGRATVTSTIGPAGLYFGTSSSESDVRLYHDGTQVASNSFTRVNTDAPTDSVYIGAANVAGLANLFTTKALGFVTIGKNFTASEVSTFTVSTKKLLTAIGR